LTYNVNEPLRELHMNRDCTETVDARVERCIIDAIANLGADADRVTPTASLAELDTDLLDLLELSQVVQAEFGVRIRAIDAERLTTVQDAIELVVSRLGLTTRDVVANQELGRARLPEVAD
jgi:acyl carrier protein